MIQWFKYLTCDSDVLEKGAIMRNKQLAASLFRVLCSSFHRYRKVVSNNCTDGVREQYTAKPQQCPGKAPRGLRVVTSDGTLTSEQGHNVTFMVQLEEVWSV